MYSIINRQKLNYNLEKLSFKMRLNHTQRNILLNKIKSKRTANSNKSLLKHRQFRAYMIVF